MKTLINNIFIPSFLFLLIIFCSPDLLSQSNSQKVSTPNEVSKTRSPYELMSLITNFIMQTYELKDGDYLKGDWNAVKKSRPPQTLYWSYPNGVCLLAMQLVYEITHDERIIKFIENNNRISSDQYEYLRWQKYTFGTTLFLWIRILILAANGAGETVGWQLQKPKCYPSCQKVIQNITRFSISIKSIWMD